MCPLITFSPSAFPSHKISYEIHQYFTGLRYFFSEKSKPTVFHGDRCMPIPAAMKPAINYVKSHWREGRTLKEVAERHDVDAGNLDRAFRHQQGMTIKHFVDERRKEHVSSRLAKRFMLGYEIAAELGFANDLAFYRWVRRAFGVSFSTLRAQMRRQAMTRKRNKK